MIESSVSPQKTGTSARPEGLPTQAIQTGALNKTNSLLELSRQIEPSPLSSGVGSTSSLRAQPDFPMIEQRQIVYVDAGTPCQEKDFTEKEKMAPINKKDAFHTLRNAITMLKDKVGHGIGEKYMDTLIKELSFVVMSRGNKTTNHGMLLHGEPGDGKTFLMETFATTLSQCIDCKVVHEKGVSFLGTDEQDTKAKFNKILFGDDPDNEPEGSKTNSSKRLIVLCIDEWDACIVETLGRLNDQVRIVSNLFKSTLSGVLDKRVDDLYIIATTNENLGNIPEALLRPGRIGKKLSIPKPTLAENKLFIERFCHEYNIDIKRFSPEKVAIVSHQEEQSVAQIKDMVVRAHQLAEIEGMERATNVALKSMASTESENTVKAVDAKTTNQHQIARDDLTALKFEHFYEVLHPKEKLTNDFRKSMEDFSSEYSREFFYDLEHSEQLPEALRIIRRISDGHKKSGIIFVTGEQGSGKTAFCAELMKLASPDIFRSTATHGQLEKIDPNLLELENEFCGKFDGFFPSNLNNRADSVDGNVHTRYNLFNAQFRFNSIVLIDDGDALMYPMEQSQIRGHRNRNASFVPANPAFYLETWHQFLDNPKNRNIALVIASTKKPETIKEYSRIRGMILGEFNLPSSISERDMEKVMVHYGLSEEDRLRASKLLSNNKLSIKDFGWSQAISATDLPV